MELTLSFLLLQDLFPVFMNFVSRDKPKLQNVVSGQLDFKMNDLDKMFLIH